MTENVAADGTGQSAGKVARRAIVAASVGTAIEWYDFFIYGTVAALLFGELFFPEMSPLAGTLAAFGTFAVGFIARPLGAVVLGHYGDRIGRKNVLAFTLVLMGGATLLIGLMPTYATIGVWAPVLLSVLRFLQGIGVGGEYGGAIGMAAEYAPIRRRGFYSSWPMMGVPAGLVLSTLVLLLTNQLLSAGQFSGWGWRTPFLLGGALAVVGLVIRLKLDETPVFREVLENNAQSKLPAAELLREQPTRLMSAIGMWLAVTVVFWVTTVFHLSYLTQQLGVSQTSALFVSVIAALAALAVCGAAGALGDRLGRRKVILAGASWIVVTAFPALMLIDTGDFWLILLGTVCLQAGCFTVAGPLAALLPEMFGTKVRYSGISLGIGVATLIGGAVTPSLATVLVAASGGRSWGVSLLLIGVGLVALVALRGSGRGASVTEFTADDGPRSPGAGPRARPVVPSTGTDAS